MERRYIEFDINNTNLGVTFTFKNGETRDYDIIQSFNENEEYYILHNGSYEYKIEKEKVQKKEFYELCIECWNCGNLCKYTERVIAKGTHYLGEKRAFERKRDFCSNDCLNNYVNNPENVFTLLE